MACDPHLIPSLKSILLRLLESRLTEEVVVRQGEPNHKERPAHCASWRIVLLATLSLVRNLLALHLNSRKYVYAQPSSLLEVRGSPQIHCILPYAEAVCYTTPWLISCNNSWGINPLQVTHSVCYLELISRNFSLRSSRPYARSVNKRLCLRWRSGS